MALMMYASLSSTISVMGSSKQPCEAKHLGMNAPEAEYTVSRGEKIVKNYKCRADRNGICLFMNVLDSPQTCGLPSKF